MAYSNQYGNRPPELASKTSHTHVIRDPAIKDYLSQCQLPPAANSVLEADIKTRLSSFVPPQHQTQSSGSWPSTVATT